MLSDDDDRFFWGYKIMKTNEQDVTVRNCKKIE